MKKLNVLIVLFCLVTAAFGQGKMTPALQKASRETKSNQKIGIIITMAEQYDANSAVAYTRYMNNSERAQFVMEDLKQFSQRSQQDLLETLQEAKGSVSDIQSFWIFNGITCQATKEMIEAIAQRPDVRIVDTDEPYVQAPMETEEVEEPSRGVEWNVQKIKADQVWNYNGTSGYTGNGVIVAIIDSGVNYKHNDLKNNLWTATGYPNHGFNFINNGNDPIENRNNGNGQGTLVAGVVAGHGTTYNTGVAPGASIMALKVANVNGQFTEANVCLAMQFAIEHGAHVIVVTSAEAGVGGRASYRDKMVNILAAGKVAFTGAGENGQNKNVPLSIAAPSNCPSPWHNPEELMDGGRSANICVGATNSNDYKAVSSSIGPVTWSGVTGYNDYPYVAGSTTQTGHIRPDVTAPGVSIRSSSYISTTAYRVSSGTFMSAAHAAGVAALLLEANPNLTPAQIDSLLELSAVKCEGLVTKNNYYGAGRIDALAAMNALLSPVSAPSNLTATALVNTVSLTWSASSGANAYNVYCDEELVESGVTTTSYEHQPGSGAHIYHVTADNGTGESGKSNFAYVFVDAEGPVVTNLAATVTGSQLNNVNLTWTPCQPNTVLRYGQGDGDYEPHTTRYWAQRFTSSQLLSCAGSTIDSISFYALVNGNHEVYLYKGTPNGTGQQLFHATVNVTNAELPAWQRVAVSPQLAIDHTTDLWVVIKTAASVSYAAASIAADNPNGFGSLASDDGKSWYTMNSSRTWLIKAHLVNGTFTYNVKIDGNTIASNLSTCAYTHNNVPTGVHYYTVTTNYNNGQSESFPCDPLRVNINTRFVVTFDAGNGTPSQTSIQQTTTNGAITLPTATPSSLCQSEGYTFVGWTEEPVEGTSTLPEMLLPGAQFIPHDDMTLYAVFALVDGETGWMSARSVYDGDQVCIVSESLHRELNNYSSSNFLITSSTYSGHINAKHPFTLQEEEQGFLLVDNNGKYLNNQGSGYVGFSDNINSGCYWTIEVIDGNAILRNEGQQFMISTDTYFHGVDYSNPIGSTYRHIQFYRYVEANDTYYIHNPECGTVVANPVIQPAGSYVDLFMDPIEVSITTTTSGASIHYTVDGSEPTSNSSTYSASNKPVINDNTLLKAKAFKTGFTTSATVSAPYYFPTTCSNISEFKALADPSYPSRILNTMQVTAQYGKYLYLTDETGGLQVYDDYGLIGSGLTDGNVVSIVQGCYDLVDGQPRLRAYHDVTSEETGTPVTPIACTINDLKDNYDTYDAQLVKIEGVYFTRSITNQYNIDTISFAKDGDTLVAMNLLHGIPANINNSYLYDVVGIVGWNDTAVMIYPRSESDIRRYHGISCLPVVHGTLASPVPSAAYMSSITLDITCEQNYHVAELFYYNNDSTVMEHIDPFTYTFLMPNFDITVAANFSLNQAYTVSFEPGSGTCETTSLTETTWHSGVTLPEAQPSNKCASAGYTFVGWATYLVEETNQAPVCYQAGTTYYPNDNLTLYAVYMLNSSYATDPDCTISIATPEFDNIPEGTILEDSYTVSISCATPDVVIYYTTDQSDPDDNATVYEGPFDITEDCIVKAIAYNALGDFSDIATQAFDFVRHFDNIAAFKTAYNSTNTEIGKISSDIRFVFRNGNIIYVCDESAGLMLKDNLNVIPDIYTNGDHITGGLIGNYNKTSKQPMMIPHYATGPGVSDSPIEPVVLNPSTLASNFDDYDAQLVTITAETFTENFTFDQTGKGFLTYTGLTVYDYFKTLTFSGNSGTRYDITGLVGRNNNTKRLYPRSNDDFSRYYNITLTQADYGTISTEALFAKEGSVVALTATPQVGYQLESWTVVDGNNNPVTVTDNSFVMPSSNVNVTATFILREYQITVSVEPVTAGIPSIIPDGPYHYNDTITVMTTVNNGYNFYNWTINGEAYGYDRIMDVAVTKDMEIVANFQIPDPYHIYLSANPEEGGVVEGAGEYLPGVEATVTATPNPGYVFLNWTENNVVVSTEAQYTFTIEGNRTLTANFDGTQVVNFQAGWSWFSSYITYDTNSLNNLEAIIGANTDAAIIKSSGPFDQLDGGVWYQNLSGLSNNQMYLISINDAMSFTLTGAIVNPAEHPINLQSGWNWISYLSANPMSLDEALSQIVPNDGDIIKGTVGFSTYNSQDTVWIGDLSTMNPGQGYMYMNNGSEAHNLVYPTASRGYVPTEQDTRHWHHDIHRFATNMSLMVSVDVASHPNYEVGAFVNGECRGSAVLHQVGEKCIAFLSVSGVDGESISFRLYDAASDQVYETVATEHLRYEADGIVGSIHEPMMLHFGNTGIDETFQSLALYPNPTRDKMILEGNAIQAVRVFNAMGQLVLSEEYGNASTVELHLGHLSAGVYTVSVTTAQQTLFKTIVKE